MTMNLKHLSQVGELVHVFPMMARLNELAMALVNLAIPPNLARDMSRENRWSYGDGGKVGLTLDLIAMAANVPADLVRELSEYIPDLDKGCLFIGHEWEVFHEYGDLKRDEDETKVCVDIAGLPYVLLALEEHLAEGTDRVPEESGPAVLELSGLANRLLESIRRAG